MGYENGSGLHGGGEDSDGGGGYLGQEGREGVLGDEGSGVGGEGDGEALAEDGGSGGSAIPYVYKSIGELNALQGPEERFWGTLTLSYMGNALYGRLEGQERAFWLTSFRVVGGQEIAREIVRRWNVAVAVEKVVGRVGE